MRRPIDSSIARRIYCPRSSSIGTATTSSCRRCRRAWIGCSPTITSLLQELLAPAGILARNDPKVRALEGLEQSIVDLAGAIPDSVSVREGPVEYQVDLRRGQKTGLFLDQRENRDAAARYARGRLLDAFSYHGGFALRLARQCTEVDAYDISADAVAHIQVNAARNGVPELKTHEENVFDALRRLERAGARYDTIVLDPPAFAKNKASVPNALAGYKEINLRAMRLLEPGGNAGDVQLLVQRQRRHVRGRPARGLR